MDCPSEEQMIRTALSGVTAVDRLGVDLSERSLTVWHRGELPAIQSRLERLKLGAELVDTADAEEPDQPAVDHGDQRAVLKLVLALNALMFAVEFVAGWLAESTGLLADSLDMLADAAVYGIALWAVARTQAAQQTAARVAGWSQLALAVGVLVEVARRAIWGSEPQPPTMAAVAGLALVVNVVCMLALSRHRSGGAHMRASWIFTTTDVIANAGVIVAGGLVAWTSSAIPDLVVGAVVGLLVLRAALKILALR